MLDRYLWVIRWRRARLQCLHPREAVSTTYSHYDKTTGLKTDFGSSLYKLAAAKAQITKARRSREAYIVEQLKRYPMFYDQATDPDLQKFDDKLARKEENCRMAQENIRLAVENHRGEHRQTDLQENTAESNLYSAFGKLKVNSQLCTVAKDE
jgi:flagellar biosynthesis/type III secretory pathway chaperone